MYANGNEYVYENVCMIDVGRNKCLHVQRTGMYVTYVRAYLPMYVRMYVCM